MLTLGTKLGQACALVAYPACFVFLIWKMAAASARRENFLFVYRTLLERVIQWLPSSVNRHVDGLVLTLGKKLNVDISSRKGLQSSGHSSSAANDFVSHRPKKDEQIWVDSIRLVYSRVVYHLRASLCKILRSSFAHKMDFAHNFSVDFV